MLSHIYSYLLVEPPLRPAKRLAAPPVLELGEDCEVNRARILEFNRAVVADMAARRIEHCEKVRQYNRKFLASQASALQNRVRVDGLCWGLLLGTILATTLLRGSSRVRKMGCMLILAQGCSEFACYQDIDIFYRQMLSFVRHEIQDIRQEHGWTKDEDLG